MAPPAAVDSRRTCPHVPPKAWRFACRGRQAVCAGPLLDSSPPAGGPLCGEKSPMARQERKPLGLEHGPGSRRQCIRSSWFQSRCTAAARYPGRVVPAAAPPSLNRAVRKRRPAASRARVRPPDRGEPARRGAAQQQSTRMPLAACAFTGREGPFRVQASYRTQSGAPVETCPEPGSERA